MFVFYSHIKGVKHAKKTMLLEEKRAQAEEEGTYIPEKVSILQQEVGGTTML